ncbi:MAG: UDP-N-acetylenolpyruvoylglucosamine reductase, partial [Oscillospiraceae bacterium]
GAYGGEICSVIKSVTALTAENEIKTFNKEECGFDYRKSIFDGGYIILSAVFSLSLGEREKIAQKMEEILNTRKAKQPLNFPSAGSTFRRPQDNFAAALIDKCGLKGFSVGGAEVSPLHAGFVINKGNATAKDVTTLCEIIKNKVFSETGVHLELEIKIL